MSSFIGGAPVVRRMATSGATAADAVLVATVPVNGGVSGFAVVTAKNNTDAKVGTGIVWFHARRGASGAATLVAKAALVDSDETNAVFGSAIEDMFALAVGEDGVTDSGIAFTALGLAGDEDDWIISVQVNTVIQTS